MKASLSNYRQSPRKVRLVANLIKGKKVSDAEVALSFLVKRASLPISNLLNSAVANAKQNNGIDKENLFVKNLTVDKGIVMKRFMPRARGMSSAINKRTSHVLIVLEEKTTTAKKGKAVKAEVVDAAEVKAEKPAKAPKATAVKKGRASKVSARHDSAESKSIIKE